MLEIVFLGTGSGIPSKKRNHPGIWMRYQDYAMLFDCGEGTQKQLMNAKLGFMKIDHIFITHWHADHWVGLIGLMQTMNLERRRRILYIHAPEAERFVHDILDLDYWGPRFKVVPKNVNPEGSDITTVFRTKNFTVSSVPVNHSVPSVAYCFEEKDSWNVDIKKASKNYGLRQGPLIGKLKNKGEITFKGVKINLKDVGILKKGLKIVYSGDTKSCKSLEKISENADMLIHDATFIDERENRMHTGVKEAAKIAKKSNVKELVLTHISRRYQDPKPLLEEAKKTFKNVRIAEDFMHINLKRE